MLVKLNVFVLDLEPLSFDKALWQELGWIMSHLNVKSNIGTLFAHIINSHKVLIRINVREPKLQTVSIYRNKWVDVYHLPLWDIIGIYFFLVY